MAINNSNNETITGLLKEMFIEHVFKKGIANDVHSWEFEGNGETLKGPVKIYDCSKLNGEDKVGITRENGLGVYVLGTNGKNGDERFGLLFGKIPVEATNEQVQAFFNNERNLSSILKNHGAFGKLEFKTLVPGKDSVYYLAQENPVQDKDSHQK